MPNFDAIFMDIDGTITDDASPTLPQIGGGHLLHNALFNVLAECATEAGMPMDEAVRRIQELNERIVFWDYPDYIEDLGLAPRSAWMALRRWHDLHLKVYADAVKLIHTCRQRADLKLFVISNNPLTGCLLKLERAGLGGVQGTPCFDRILCANLLRGQKHDPGFWRRALAHTDVDPGRVVAIGDSANEDGAVPLGVGIRTCCIIDRQRSGRHPALPGLTVVDDLLTFTRWL